MKIYFNTKFDTYATRKSAMNYIKISITEIHGMFAVIGIVDTGKVSIQSFPDVTGEHIWGLTSKNNYEENDFYKLVLPNLDNKTIVTFSKAMEEINRAFKNHIIKNNIPADEQSEIYRELAEFKKRFTDEVKNNEGNNSAKNTVGEWKQIDDIVNELTAEELDNAITALNEDKQAIFNGREYRIIEEGNRGILQYRELNGVTPSNDISSIKKEEKPVITRKSVQMAFMVNADGLNEFSKHHFYKFIRQEGNEFAIIENENGDQRTLNKSRIKMVNVYVDPPVCVEA